MKSTLIPSAENPTGLPLSLQAPTLITLSCAAGHITVLLSRAPSLPRKDKVHFVPQIAYHNLPYKGTTFNDLVGGGLEEITEKNVGGPSQGKNNLMEQPMCQFLHTAAATDVIV